MGVGDNGKLSVQNDTVIFIDNSGSTRNSDTYWRAVQQFLAKYNPGHVFLWNTRLEESERLYYYESRGVTIPKVCVKRMKQLLTQGVERVIFFTDGQVGQEEVIDCHDALVKHEVRIPELVFVIVGRDNVSVPQPFMQCSDACILHVNGEVKATLIIGKLSDTVEELDAIKGCREFEELYNNLEMKMVVHRRERDLTDLFGALRRLKYRLKVEILGGLLPLAVQDFDAAVAKDEWQTLLLLMPDVVNSNSDALKTVLIKVDQLMVVARDSTTYDMQTLRATASRHATADNVSEEDQNLSSDVVEGAAGSGSGSNAGVEDEADDDLLFEYPILYENDVPTLIIVQCVVPFLYGGDEDFKKMQALEDQPLRLLGDEAIAIGLSESLDVPIGWATSIKLGDSPFSRRPIIYRLPLVALGNADSEAVRLVRRAQNSAVQQLFFGKAMGKPAVLLLALWHHLNSSPRLEYLKEIVPLLGDMVKERLMTDEMPISMCGMMDFPQFPVCLKTALVFVLHNWRCQKQYNFAAVEGITNALCAFCPLLLEKEPSRKGIQEILEIAQLFEALRYLMKRKFDLDPIRDIVRTLHTRSAVLQDGRLVFFDQMAVDEKDREALEQKLPTSLSVYKRNVPFLYGLLKFVGRSWGRKFTSLDIRPTLKLLEKDPEMPPPLHRYFGCGSDEVGGIVCPGTYMVYENVPDPSNPSTLIHWSLVAQEFYHMDQPYGEFKEQQKLLILSYICLFWKFLTNKRNKVSRITEENREDCRKQFVIYIANRTERVIEASIDHLTRQTVEKFERAQNVFEAHFGVEIDDRMLQKIRLCEFGTREEMERVFPHPDLVTHS